MTNLLVQHTVEDYGSWKKVFDDHAAMREAAGCRGGEVYQNAENPNEVWIHFNWDSVAHAREFVASEDLRNTMKRAGVLGQPKVTILGEAQPVTR